MWIQHYWAIKRLQCAHEFWVLKFLLHIQTHAHTSIRKKKWNDVFTIIALGKCRHLDANFFLFSLWQFSTFCLNWQWNIKRNQQFISREKKKRIHTKTDCVCIAFDFYINFNESIHLALSFFLCRMVMIKLNDRFGTKNHQIHNAQRCEKYSRRRQRKEEKKLPSRHTRCE